MGEKTNSDFLKANLRRVAKWWGEASSQRPTHLLGLPGVDAVLVLLAVPLDLRELTRPQGTLGKYILGIKSSARKKTR